MVVVCSIVPFKSVRKQKNSLTRDFLPSLRAAARAWVNRRSITHTTYKAMQSINNRTLVANFMEYNNNNNNNITNKSRKKKVILRSAQPLPSERRYLPWTVVLHGWMIWKPTSFLIAMIVEEKWKNKRISNKFFIPMLFLLFDADADTSIVVSIHFSPSTSTSTNCNFCTRSSIVLFAV